MNFEIFNNMRKFIIDYTDNSFIGYFRLIIDLAIVIGIIFMIYHIFLKYTNRKALFYITGSLILAFLVIILFDLLILYALFPYIILVVVVVWLIYNAQKLRNIFGDITKNKNMKNFVMDEGAQEELISTLIKSAEYLSSRQIGAIITIEKEDSLNTYINKGTKLNSEISFELLSTIFMPGTALHDGAVIIRGKHIMCAGAFYPSTDKNDIPKNYGSRHRAAIGISEVTDAFTIVVSEETGKIALTLDGTITPDVSLDSLRVYLKQNIIVE